MTRQPTRALGSPLTAWGGFYEGLLGEERLEQESTPMVERYDVVIADPSGALAWGTPRAERAEENGQ